MARNYAVSDAKTNTLSTTVPLGNLTGAATIRPRIYEILMGSDAVASNAAKYAFQRGTARGTQSTSVTPQALEPSDPGATCTWDNTWSVNPTLTGSAFLWTLGLNQQITYRWLAAPGKELIMPATAGAGLALMCLTQNAAFNAVYTTYFEE